MLKAEKRALAVLALLLATALLLCGPGCKKKPKVDNDAGSYIPPDDPDLPGPPDVQDPDQDEVVMGDVGFTETEVEDLGTPLPTPIRPGPGEEPMVSELQTVFFAFDSSQLSPEAQAVLDANAQWLFDHDQDIHVLIEGHCDERGTVEYNLNLGQRRADSVREHLIGKGIDPARLHTISYGEERPLVDGQTEEAYSQNRRAQFLVY